MNNPAFQLVAWKLWFWDPAPGFRFRPGSSSGISIPVPFPAVSFEGAPPAVMSPGLFCILSVVHDTVSGSSSGIRLRVFDFRFRNWDQTVAQLVAQTVVHNWSCHRGRPEKALNNSRRELPALPALPAQTTSTPSANSQHELPARTPVPDRVHVVTASDNIRTNDLIAGPVISSRTQTVCVARAVPDCSRIVPRLLWIVPGLFPDCFRIISELRRNVLNDPRLSESPKLIG